MTVLLSHPHLKASISQEVRLVQRPSLTKREPVYGSGKKTHFSLRRIWAPFIPR